ncbi:hypothetical protein D3C72_1126690 [compost metagenome]
MTSKVYLAFILIFIAVKSEAAFLCSQALLPIRLISRAEEKAAINDIAQLSMELDLAKINGIDSPVIASMRANFPFKMAELTSKLSGKYSEAQIKELVSAKVRELQNRSKLESQEEANRRAQQITAMKINFKRTGEIPLDDVRSGFKGSLFEYIPSIDSFLFQNASKKELVLMNAQSKERRVLQEGSGTAVFLPKRNEILAIDTNGTLLRYDLTTGVVHPGVDIRKKGVWGKVAVSPNEDRIIVKNESDATAYVFDPQGKWTGAYDVKTIRNNESIDYEFLSQDEALTSNGRLRLLNFVARTSVQLNAIGLNTSGNGFSVHDLTISPDRKLLYWAGDQHETKGVVALEDIRNFEKASILLPKETGNVIFGKKEDEVYLDFKTSRGLYKFPDLTAAEQLLPLDPNADLTVWGDAPVFGTSEKMFIRHSNIIEIWERE